MGERGLPARFENEAELEEVMTRPSTALIDDLARLDGDIAILGVGGKMGPTLARLASGRRRRSASSALPGSAKRVSNRHSPPTAWSASGRICSTGRSWSACRM